MQMLEYDFHVSLYLLFVQLDRTCVLPYLTLYEHVQIRFHAVQSLSMIPEGDFVDILPQLCQALKYELYMLSPLTLLLLERALRSPLRIGIGFYRMLKVRSLTWSLSQSHMWKD